MFLHSILDSERSEERIGFTMMYFYFYMYTYTFSGRMSQLSNKSFGVKKFFDGKLILPVRGIIYFIFLE